MNDILASIDNRDGKVFTDYYQPVGGIGAVERRINDWINSALRWNGFNTTSFYVLDDAKSVWTFGFEPSQKEFDAIQKILMYWQFRVQFHYHASPLIRISPSVHASTYENIIGLQIWLRDNIGPVRCPLPATIRERHLALVSSRIYLRAADYWLHAISAGGLANPHYTNMQPVRCFRFAKFDVERRGETNVCAFDQFPFYRVEVIDRDFGAQLATLINSFRSPLLRLMENLPEVSIHS